MIYIWTGIKLLCFPFVVLDRTMQRMIQFEEGVNILRSIANRDVGIVIDSNVCFECGEVEEKHPLNNCCYFRPIPPPADTG